MPNSTTKPAAAQITRFPHRWTSARIIRHARNACLKAKGDIVKGLDYCPFTEAHQDQMALWIQTYHTAMHNLSVTLRMARAGV